MSSLHHEETRTGRAIPEGAPAPPGEHGPAPEPHPRPEAVALGWREMLKNTREATEALIEWLLKAIEVGRGMPSYAARAPRLLTAQLATSVLVAGDRGFGKTTVLLSGQTAFQKPDTFIPKEVRDADPRARALHQTLHENANAIVWLDPLDLEPLPPDANLLATLLVRIQNALQPDGATGEESRAGSSALLAEEGLEAPWAKIGQLVREASFMWERGSAEADPREHVSHQIKAAQIYSTFRGHFYEAIDSVASLQSVRRYGLGHERPQVILVLPIDNVDRSIQHLNLILKLIRMVASPRLWFVLASGGHEFQLFLERTFHQELSEAGQFALGDAARETSLAIARRQAAGAIRRVLPELHRIEIEPLSPSELWDFRAPKAMAGGQEEGRCIRELLGELRVPRSRIARDPHERGPRFLSEFFELQGRLSSGGSDSLVLQECRQVLEAVGEGEERCASRSRTATVEAPIETRVFTQAGRLALSMSARSAVDLWHEARRLAGREPPEDGPLPPEREGEQAICLAHRMLTLAIDESELPSWASEQLLHRVLRYDAQKRVLLDLTETPIQRLKLTTLSDALEWPEPTVGAGDVIPALRSELHLRHVMDLILVMSDLDRPGRSVYLPSNVAGWYMLLHDLLVFTTDGRVLTRGSPTDVTPPVVVTRHETLMPRNRLVELNLTWMLPEWGTFLDSFVFTVEWRAFLHRLLRADVFRSASTEGVSDHLRLILASWIHCTCEVSGPHAGLWEWESLEALVTRWQDPERRSEALEAYEQRVAESVREVYGWARRDPIRFGRVSVARHWLEYFLPLLLGAPAFLPTEISRNLRERVLREDSTLPQRWNELLLWQRLHELIGEAMRNSPAFAQMKALYNASTGEGAQECGHWLETVCDLWLEAQEASLSALRQEVPT